MEGFPVRRRPRRPDAQPARVRRAAGRERPGGPARAVRDADPEHRGRADLGRAAAGSGERQRATSRPPRCATRCACSSPKPWRWFSAAAGLHARELSPARERRAGDRPRSASAPSVRRSHASARLRDPEPDPGRCSSCAGRARGGRLRGSRARSSGLLSIRKYLDFETRTLQFESLDVKSFLIEESGHVPKLTKHTDHVDRWLEEIASCRAPSISRWRGSSTGSTACRRRFLRMLDETLADFGLSDGEWKVLEAPAARRGRRTALVRPARQADRALERGDDEPARPAGGGWARSARCPTPTTGAACSSS